jgi:hypothetical protein
MQSAGCSDISPNSVCSSQTEPPPNVPGRGFLFVAVNRWRGRHRPESSPCARSAATAIRSVGRRGHPPTPSSRTGASAQGGVCHINPLPSAVIWTGTLCSAPLRARMTATPS